MGGYEKVREISKMCTKCGERPANHMVYKHWESPEEQELCCECNVNDGSPPADWHPDCMKAYEAKKRLDSQGDKA